MSALNKQNQRLHAKKLLSQFTDNEISLKSEKIYHTLIKLLDKLTIPKNLIGVYVPIKGEVDLFNSHDWSGFKLCIPQTEEGLKMNFYSCEAKKMKSLNYSDKFSLNEELVTPKTIIIPGLGFDKSLNRLGRGKGFYDRYLDDEIIKIGVCFEKQILESIEINEYDIKMNYIITENTVYKGNK